MFLPDVYTLVLVFAMTVFLLFQNLGISLWFNYEECALSVITDFLKNSALFRTL